MRSFATILAWQIWRRHRRGLCAFLAGMLGLSLLFQVMPAGQPARTVADFDLFLYVIGFFYAVAVFSFGFESDVAARNSGYPARMFTLPVRTWALVFWPMLYGAAAVALPWLALAWFVLRPLKPWMPVWAMALFYAAGLAWLQAVLWSPFRLPWLRVVVAVLVLVSFPVLLQVCVDHGAGDWGLFVLSTALIPLAYLVALAGVSRARCGDTAEGHWLPGMAYAARVRLLRRKLPFASADRAQLWLEWRQRGVLLPLFVGGTLALALPGLPAFERFVEQMVISGLFPSHAAVVETGGPVLIVLAYLLLLPPLFATILGGSLGMPGFLSRDPYALPSFTAVRPLSDAALVAAKLWSAALSTLAAWAILLLVVIGWFVLAGGWGQWQRFQGHWLPHLGNLTVAASVLGVLVGLVLLTWLQLAKGLLFTLTGRKWVVLGSTGLNLTFWFSLAVLALRYQEVFLGVLPWLVGAAVLLKLLAAGLALPAVLRHGAIPPRSLVYLASLWLLIAASLIVLLAWLVGAHDARLVYLALGVVLLLPFTRLAATPLALAWDRHR